MANKNRDESGAFVVLGVITLGGMLLFMFMSIQITKMRRDSMRLLYHSIQLGQAAFHNAPYEQKSLDSMIAYSTMENLGLPKYTMGGTTSQSADLNGDGTTDGTATVNITKGDNTPIVVTVELERIDNFLDGFFGILSPGLLKTRIQASGALKSFFNVAVDMTNPWNRVPYFPKISNSFGVTHNAISGYLTSPSTERQILPGYMTGDLLYSPGDTAGTYVQNCADPRDATQYNTYYGVEAVNMYDASLYPWVPNVFGSKQNGYCVYPYDPVDPSGDCCEQASAGADCGNSNEPFNTLCPSQFYNLVEMNDFVLDYRKYIEVFFQFLSSREEYVRASVIGGPTSGGAILESASGGGTVYGDFTIFDGTNMYRETIDPTSLGLITTSGTGSTPGTPPCDVFDFPTNVNVHLGAYRWADWRGRVSSTDFPELAVTNHVGRSAGHKLLRPLRNPEEPSFPYANCGPTNETGNDHPAFSGFKKFGSSANSALFFSQIGQQTYDDGVNPPLTITWPTIYRTNIDGSLMGLTYPNQSVSWYAPCLFASVAPIDGGRDIRGALANATAACQAKKTAHGNATPCVTILITGREPDLTEFNNVPTCTTGTSYTYAQHKSAIESSLATLESLDNTLTILVHVGPKGASAHTTETLDWISMFENQPKRFLIQMHATVSTGITTRMRDAIIGLNQITRDAPQIAIP